MKTRYERLNHYRPSALVPTHGDCRRAPGLWDDGRLVVVDLGRFEAQRHAMIDAALVAF